MVAATTNGATTGELAEDGYPKDMEIPVRYVKGMEGDMVEARRRWIATLKVMYSFLGTTGTTNLPLDWPPLRRSMLLHRDESLWRATAVGVVVFLKPGVTRYRQAASSFVFHGSSQSV